MTKLTPVERATIGQVPTNPEDQFEFAKLLCESLGLNHLTRPFEFISLNGRMVVYATKNCTDQLRAKFGVSITEMKTKESRNGVYTVTVSGRDKDGRTDISTGSVSLLEPPFVRDGAGKRVPNPKAGQPLEAEDCANAKMKAETKSKRRLTLSLCGLGMLDESELETIKPSGELFGDDPDKKPIVEQDLNLLKGSWRSSFAQHENDKERMRIEFSNWVGGIMPHIKDPHDWRSYTCADVMILEKLCHEANMNTPSDTSSPS